MSTVAYACQDKKTRDKAIKSLAAFLSDPSREALPKAEMAKLWKGVFYCTSAISTLCRPYGLKGMPFQVTGCQTNLLYNKLSQLRLQTSSLLSRIPPYL